MKRGFKTLRESNRPLGFEYTCAEGHSWFVKAADYNDFRYNEDGSYKDNFCPECATMSEPDEAPLMEAHD